jgi:hypothetical protein
MQEGSSMEWMCLSLEHLLQPAISFDFSWRPGLPRWEWLPTDFIWFLFTNPVLKRHFDSFESIIPRARHTGRHRAGGSNCQDHLALLLFDFKSSEYIYIYIFWLIYEIENDLFLANAQPSITHIRVYIQCTCATNCR